MRLWMGGRGMPPPQALTSFLIPASQGFFDNISYRLKSTFKGYIRKLECTQSKKDVDFCHPHLHRTYARTLYIAYACVERLLTPSSANAENFSDLAAALAPPTPEQQNYHN